MPDVQNAFADTVFERIHDWESGISQTQIEIMRKELGEKAAVRSAILVSTTEDGALILHLYELLTCLLLEFYKKNSDIYLHIKGVIMNPYLTSHPFYESVFGYVPYLFWQGNQSPESLMKRYETWLFPRIQLYFPTLEANKLKIIFNFAMNFRLFKGNELIAELFKKRFPEMEINMLNIGVEDVCTRTITRNPQQSEWQTNSQSIIK